MLPKLKITQQAIIMVALPLVLQLVFIVGLAELLSRARAAQQQEFMAKQAVADVNELLELSFNQGFALFRYSFTRAEADADHFERLGDRFVETLYDLELRTLHDEEQFVRVRKLKRIANAITDKLKLHMEALEQRHALPSMNLVEIRRELEPLSRALMNTVHEFSEAEKASKKSNPENEAYYSELLNLTLFAGVLLNLVVAAALTGYFNKSTSTRLNLLMDNIVRLSKRKELHPPISGDDEISSLDATFREMADALALASARERAILENAADVIFSTSETLQITAISNASEAVLGYTPAELIGKRIDSFIAPEGLEKVAEKLRDTIASNQIPAFETTAIKSDGTLVDMLLSVRWSAKERSYFCVAQNISAQKELQRAKQDFYAMVSHDLRSPLSSFQIFLNSVNRGIYGKLSPEGDERTSRQISELERLINMINSLLDIEKVEAGKLELLREEVCIDTIIEKAIYSLAISAERAGTQIQWTPCGTIVYADEDRLVQVLVNFISNAVKYSPRGGSIRVETLDHEDYFEVSVSDTGCGIPENLQASIFDKFQQVRTAETKRGNSSGLGLAIAKKLVEEHGGSIGVRSREGEGSTFWFRLHKFDASREVNPEEDEVEYAESADGR